ncbi:nuclear mRNA export protein SAC3 [Entomortierella parvispora]|uniref:Nuclear mRNA export protein SAC3 n=1 Tax=Entomortierella parvispora TaxID=205924 RepID=A0A9P3H9B6_9FUNG|nr:nuclear mRNA export protein SAC3 [Entomortierella parvispora]
MNFNSPKPKELNNPEDAESRLARFTAVPIGNRFEELKGKRVKEREDAIKQGLLPDPNKPTRLEDAITFVGTCLDMCPEFERHEREYQQNVEIFEKINGTESIDHSRAVKMYHRPAAGADQPLPSDVRPPPVLLLTLDYLIREIVAEDGLSESHAFVRDRTRSIRQDFTLQNSRGIEAVQAHEIIARFHILCVHQLCESKNFSAQQEMEQLRKVLTSLQEFYDDLRLEGVPCPNEAEFRAYHILSHLHDPDMIRQAQLLPPHIFNDPYIQVAAEIHALTRRNNDIRRRGKVQSEASPNFFSRFFKMIAGPATTYLMACLLETNFVDIRKGALKALNKAYMEKYGGFSVQELVNILGFDDMEECITNCQEYGLEVTMQGQPQVIYNRRDGKIRIWKEGSLALKQHRNVRLVESKRQPFTTSQIIYGQTPGPFQRSPAGSGSILPAMRFPPMQQHQMPYTSMAKPTLQSSALAKVGNTSGIQGQPVTAAQSSKPFSGVFDFGLGDTASTVGAVGTGAVTSGSGSSTFNPAASAPGVGFSQNTIASAFAPISTSTSTSSLRNGQPLSTSSAFSSSLNPAAPAFTPANATPGTGGFSFVGKKLSSGLSTGNIPGTTSNLSLSTTAGASLPSFTSTRPTTSLPLPSVSQSTMGSSFTGIPSTATGPSINFMSNTSVPVSNRPPAHTAPLFSLSSSVSTAGPLSASSSISRDTPVQPLVPSILPQLTTVQVPTIVQQPERIVEPPKSDATRIVTRRGRVYPRSVVEAVLNELLDRERERLVRSTASQVVQQTVLERSRQRALARQLMIREETKFIMDQVVNQATEDVLNMVMAELYRERKVQQKAIDRWKAFTAQCRKRAEELKRKQEYFLKNVRAMGTRSGLLRDDSEDKKILARMREIRATAAYANGGAGVNGGQDLSGVKAMVKTVVNKRKRLLSIGQDGMSPDLQLVTGFRKVMAPRREKWAPLPVLDIVEKQYRQSHLGSDSKLGADVIPVPMQSKKKTRSWRLFVNIPSFKQTSSKWLLSKLGIDMGRQTKSQQRSGSMISIHSKAKSLDYSMPTLRPLDVIVHGSEDTSVMNILGLSKEAILQAGAFIFEFSKIPFQDEAHVTQDTIRQYWLGERGRLVRFLACFPQVQQPIVFIMWSRDPEIWERISPRVVEYLELDSMLAQPGSLQTEHGGSNTAGGPLLGYRFLNLDMSTMKLDPYIIGSLEWLATETRDRDEEADLAEEERDARRKRGLDIDDSAETEDDRARAWEERMRLDALEWDREVDAMLLEDKDHVGLGRKRLAPVSDIALRRDMKRSRILQGMGSEVENGAQTEEESPNLFLVNPDQQQQQQPQMSRSLQDRQALSTKRSSTEALTPPTTPSRQLKYGSNGALDPLFKYDGAPSASRPLFGSTTTQAGVPTSPFSFSLGTPMPTGTGRSGLTAFSFHLPLTSGLDQSKSSSPSMLTPTSGSGPATDRLARLRSLINREKSKLQPTV